MQRNRPILIAAAGLVFVGDVLETGSLFGRPRPWWFLRSIYASISLVLASSVPEITRKALLLENIRLRISSLKTSRSTPRFKTEIAKLLTMSSDFLHGIILALSAV